MMQQKNPHLPLRVFLSLGEKIEVRALWHTSFVSLALILCLTVGCETANYAPRITSTSAAKRNVDQRTLDRGRNLFVHRCIECHTLPPIWKYSNEDWPKIVDDMSHRASLTPEDREAVVAYILAARASESRSH